MRVRRLNKTELASLLCVSCSKIEMFERDDKLKDELALCGYKYHGKEMIKRKNVYKLTLEDKNKSEFYNICKKEFDTHGDSDFKTYFTMRISDRAFTRKDIAFKCNVSHYTVRKWDIIMIDKGILIKVDRKYFKKHKTNDEIHEITKDEYWCHFLDNDIVIRIEDDYLNGTITEEQYRSRLKDFSRQLNENCDYYYFKSPKYTVNTNNELYKQLKFLSDKIGE